MVQPDTLLHEAFVLMFRRTGFNADCRPATYAIEKPIPVEHRRHSEPRQKPAIESSCGRKVTHGQHNMCHPIYFDRHGASPIVLDQWLLRKPFRRMGRRAVCHAGGLD
jgi:hypothetical protein